MSFGVWCFSAPDWGPASTAVMIMRLFPFGWISVPKRGSRHQASPSSLPDLPQAFARIPPLQGRAAVLHTAQCPTTAGRSPAPETYPGLEKSPWALPFLPFPLLILLAFTFFFLRFSSCPRCRALQSSPRDLRYTSTLTLAGRAERVTAPVAALAGRGVHVFHPFLSACVHVWKILTHFFPSGFSCWLLFLWVGHSRVPTAKSSW